MEKEINPQLLKFCKYHKGEEFMPEEKYSDPYDYYWYAEDSFLKRDPSAEFARKNWLELGLDEDDERGKHVGLGIQWYLLAVFDHLMGNYPYYTLSKENLEIYRNKYYEFISKY